MRHFFVAVTLLSIFWTAFSRADEAKCVTDLLKATNSNLLERLESPSQSRTNWIHKQNRAVNKSLKEDPNKTAIENWLWKLFDRERVYQSEIIDQFRTLQIVNRGLGKPTDLVLIDSRSPAGKTILYSSFQLKKNTSFTFLNFTLSPQNDYVALSFTEKGSTDDYRLVILDLKSGNILNDNLLYQGLTPLWTGSSTLLYQSEGTNQLVTYEVLNPKGPPPGDPGFIVESKVVTSRMRPSSAWSIFQKGGAYHFVSGDGKSFTFYENGVWPSETIGLIGSTFYFRTKGKNQSGDVRSVQVEFDKPAQISSSQVVIPETRNIISNAYKRQDYLFIESYFGRRQMLEILDAQGRTVKKIDIPESSVLENSEWLEVGKTLTLTLSSEVIESYKATFDLETMKFKERDINKVMLTLDGQEYVSSILETISADGTSIPIRITHLKELPRDGEQAAFINTYGGFSMPYGFYPRFDAGNLEFLKRGGILVDPAVRGGDELGEKWHTAAMLEHKNKTFEDLAATAQYLIQEKYSNPRKIILMGTSNGGMVVAATGLLYPQLFGLIVAISGVQDMLGRDRMDARNHGWDGEYGSDSLPEMIKYLKTISPVELASHSRTDGAHFLIVNGRNDSRVNPAHSFKLMSAFQFLGRKQSRQFVEMVSINNSGHWLASPWYQNVIGWRTQVIIWSKILSQLGWTF